MTIICDKAEHAIDKLEDESVDILITSPPYNVDLGNNKYHHSPYDVYKDNKLHQDYINWLRSVFYGVYPKMKSGGRVVINIGDGKNGSVPTHKDILDFMVEIGYIVMTQIIWNKNTTGNRTAWGSYGSPSSPSIPCPYEHILVFAKETKVKELDFTQFYNQNCTVSHLFSAESVTWKELEDMRTLGPDKLGVKLAKRELKREKNKYSKYMTTITNREFIDYAWGIWSFAPETRQKKLGHPAMFPVELPRRILKMFSYRGDTVLDPFMGLGTTGLACKELDRNFIGVDMSTDYCEMAQKRIDDYVVN